MHVRLAGAGYFNLIQLNAMRLDQSYLEIHQRIYERPKKTENVVGNDFSGSEGWLRQ